MLGLEIRLYSRCGTLEFCKETEQLETRLVARKRIVWTIEAKQETHFSVV